MPPQKQNKKNASFPGQFTFSDGTFLGRSLTSSTSSTPSTELGKQRLQMSCISAKDAWGTGTVIEKYMAQSLHIGL